MLGKPVLCLHRQGARVSKMITGNSEPGISVRAYTNQAGALEAMAEFLAALGAGAGRQ
jgi:hypothetical protein